MRYIIPELTKEEAQPETREKITEADFTAIFNTYRSGLCNYVFKKTRSMALAEDVIHDVFLKIWLKQIDLRTINNCWSYLCVLARNRMLDILKKSRREVSIDVNKYENCSAGSGTEDLVLYREYECRLEKITRKLPQQRQMAFRLVKVKGFTHKETASVMELSDLTVKKHVSTALKFIDHHFRMEGITSLQ